MTDQWDRVSGILGDGLSRLQDARVAIIGLGSLGSTTALFLAMAGVKHFVLVDPDILEAHNIVRHAADLRYVGMPKVDAVADLILNRNPDAIVETVVDDIRNNFDAINTADLVLVAGLGSEIVTTLVSMELRERGKIAFYGGVYEKAIAGEVFIVHPALGPCYSCFATLLHTMDDAPTDQVVDYGVPRDEFKAQPGLGIHVARIATLFADWSVRFLIRDEKILGRFPGNLAILSNSLYTIGTDGDGNNITIEPSSAFWMRVPQSVGCHMCNPAKIESVPIDESLGG